MMKILVTGSDGLIGTNILPYLSKHFEIIPMTEKHWDILDRKLGEEILRTYRPDILINLAAITNVDGCEDASELAYRVNAEGAGVLAGLCGVHNVKLLHFSTDYVFDGTSTRPYTEEDKPNPLSVYGLSKLIGEKKVLDSRPSSLVIRTEWIYGKGGENFISKVTKIAREKGRVEVVDDQTGAPTFAQDLAEPLKALIDQDKSGIYHVTNSGACTWFQFANEIFSILRIEVPCLPISSARIQRRAKRPAYSVLDCSKLKQEAGVSLRPWQQALRQYLVETS
jgi:dTDP-4-dehydrorhamnose reductase